MARRKRGQNEGSIWQRGPSHWEGAVSLPRGSAKSRKYFSGKTRQEVQDKINAALVALKRGVDLSQDPERLTVGEWLLRWVEELGHLKPTTVAMYRSVIRVHLIPELGHVRLGELRRQHIKMYQQKKAAAGLAPRTIRQHRVVLSAALRDAVDDDALQLERNAVREAKAPKAQREAPRFLRAEDVHRLLRALEGDVYRPAIVVALTLGLRMGEVRGLRWRDFDRDLKRVTIRQQIQSIPGHPTTVLTVKQSRERVLDVPEPAREALAEQRRLQARMRLRRGKEWLGSEHDLVFTTRTGAPIKPNELRERFKARCVQAGIQDAPHRKFHELRKSFGSLLLAEGVDLKTISAMLGHASIGVTADIYAGVIDELKEAAQSQWAVILG